MKIPFLSRFFGTEKRSTYDQSWYSGDPWPGTQSASGAYVTPDKAIRISAVYACVRILSETLACLPLIVYRRLPDGGKERASDHPLYRTLAEQPNPFQTSFEWREQMQAHLCLRGNAYSGIVMQGAGLQLLPIHPDRCVPRINDVGKIVYQVYGGKKAGTRIRSLPAGKMLHIRGLGVDGFMGLSPIELSREHLGEAISQQKNACLLWANGMRPGGMIKVPSGNFWKTEDDEKKWLKAFRESATGNDAYKNIVLKPGMEFEPVKVNNVDAQFLENRKFSVEEIARIFRIPLHLLQSLDKATFSNIVHQSLEFVQYTMLPWLRRWENRLNIDLLSETDRDIYFCEFLVDGLLRGDAESRFKAYSQGRQWGWLSINDIRRLENMNPVEGGDTFLDPMNMKHLNEPDSSVMNNQNNN